jgi:cell wall-associated NlpC family hydrolase
MAQKIITPEMVVAAARSYRGVPYANAGRSRQFGMSCTGYIIAVALDLGLLDEQKDMALIRKADSSVRPNANDLSEMFAQHMVKLKSWREARVGDVVSMAYARAPRHCGIVTDWHKTAGYKVAHAVEEGITEHWFDQVWKRRLRDAYRLKELADEVRQK